MQTAIISILAITILNSKS